MQRCFPVAMTSQHGFHALAHPVDRHLGPSEPLGRANLRDLEPLQTVVHNHLTTILANEIMATQDLKLRANSTTELVFDQRMDPN
jgi:hypothetical protein